MPFYHLSTEQVYGLFCFDQVNSSTDFIELTDMIRAAFPTNYSSYQATVAFAITWSINSNTSSSLYQVVLCLDERTNSSFMIVIFAELGLPSEKHPSFYFDTDLQANLFQSSINDSNCGIPGRFVFQLNSIHPQTCLLILYFDYIFFYSLISLLAFIFINLNSFCYILPSASANLSSIKKKFKFRKC
jgi:hypothetical protein